MNEKSVELFFCLSVCSSVLPYICKIFKFTSSSLEPLTQYLPHLAQNIIDYIKNEGQALLPRRLNSKMWYKNYLHLKPIHLLIKRKRVNVNHILLKASTGKEMKVSSKECLHSFPKEIMAKVHCHFNFFSRTTWGNVFKLGINLCRRHGGDVNLFPKKITLF